MTNTLFFKLENIYISRYNMKKTTIQEVLKEKIPESLLTKVKRSFEIVGDIAITEVEEELIPYEKEIGEAIITTNKSIKVVLKKSGIHGGEFRTQELVHIAGENRKETIYTENNIKLKINPETVYFSAKLSTEREQLMKNVADDARALVLFSGCGPYSFVALRKNPDIGRITSVELNPEGHNYALESLELNKNIIKKSHIYDNLLGFLDANEVPAIEKILRKNMNFLRLHFINADVREAIEAFPLKTKKAQKEFEEEAKEHTELLFKNHPHWIVETLNELKPGTLLTLNFDKVKDPEDFVPYLVMYATKFNFKIQIEHHIYEFNTGFEKGLLLNYLEHERKIPLEEIHLFDEIYMPLPKDAHLFLDTAFKAAAKNATIHMYDFVHESEFPHETEGRVITQAKKAGVEVEVLQVRKVGQYAPGKYRVCCDFKVL